METITVTENALVDLYGATKGILNQVIQTRNFDAGFEYINELHEQGRKFAAAIGIMIEGMEKEWKAEEHEGETFMQAAVRKTDLHPATIRRHSTIQRFLDSGVVPENVFNDIRESGQKSLVRIANVADRIEISPENWNKIAEVADDEKSLSVVLRKIEKKEPRSNWLAISIDERGILTAHTKTERIEIGRLNIGNKSETAQKALDRIIGCAGILNKVEY